MIVSSQQYGGEHNLLYNEGNLCYIPNSLVNFAVRLDQRMHTVVFDTSPKTVMNCARFLKNNNRAIPLTPPLVSLSRFADNSYLEPSAFSKSL